MPRGLSAAKKFAAAVLILLILMMAGGCAAVNLKTDIELDKRFSGERLMTVSFDLAKGEKYFSSLDELDALIEKEKPEALSFERLESDGQTAKYAFKLSFKSKAEYERKLKEIIGQAVTVEFDHVDKIFSKGLTYTESFESRDLFKWVDSAIKDSGMLTPSDLAAYDPAEFWTQESVTDITVSGKKYSVQGGKVEIKEGRSNLIKTINFKTAISGNSVFERTIEFKTIPSIDEGSAKKISEYIADVSPEGSKFSESSSEGVYTFSVSFTAANTSELSKKTAAVLGNNSAGSSLFPTEDTSAPFSRLEAFEESLDFSAIAGDEPVAFSYKIDSSRGAPTRLISYQGANETEAQPVISGSSMVFTSEGQSVKLRTILERISSAEKIQANLNVISPNEFSREITIFMASDTPDEALEQIRMFYEEKKAKNTQITVERPSNLSQEPYVRIFIKGTGEQLVAAENALFSGSKNRKVSYEKTKSLFNFTPKVTLTDEFDISSLLSMTNVNSLVYTANSIDAIKSITGVFGGKESVNKLDTPVKSIGVELSTGVGAYTLEGTYFNITAVVTVSLLILLMIALISFGVVFVLRKREENGEQAEKEEQTANASESTPPAEEFAQSFAEENKAASEPSADIAFESGAEEQSDIISLLMPSSEVEIAEAEIWEEPPVAESEPPSEIYPWEEEPEPEEKFDYDLLPELGEESETEQELESEFAEESTSEPPSESPSEIYPWEQTEEQTEEQTKSEEKHKVKVSVRPIALPSHDYSEETTDYAEKTTDYTEEIADYAEGISANGYSSDEISAEEYSADGIPVEKEAAPEEFYQFRETPMPYEVNFWNDAESGVENTAPTSTPAPAYGAAKQSYTDENMVDDLAYLGLLDRYVESTAKVKVRVKRRDSQKRF